jgi:citrate lyase gamma subunit
VGEARNANRVAEKGVAVTLESGKAQVRAYMSLSDFKIKIDADNKVVIKYRYTNNGQSPAVRVTIDIGATVEKLPFFGGPINRTVTHILDDVPAHFSEENEARISLGISAEAMAVYSANAFGAFVAYRIAYEDVFGDSHIRSMNYIGLWAPGAKKDDFVRMNRSPLDDNRGGGYSEQPPPSPKDKTP